MDKDNTNKYNENLIRRLSIYLNDYSNYIKKDDIESMMKDCDLDELEAYKLLLFSFLEYDMDTEEGRIIYDYYFNDLVSKLDIDKYTNNLYYKNIKIDNKNNNDWKLKYKKYEPYEAFVYDDMKQYSDGRIVPQLGYFNEEFKYPCVMQNDREWMLITPNEIETMSGAISDAFGYVLTYGLGLGYFAYMVSLKPEVNTITIVERDENIIKLFEQHILPQFEHKEKIRIINADAFEYAENYDANYSFVFADIWHDVLDGLDLYLKFKKLERENVVYRYWIEDTIKCYTNQ